MQFINEIKPDDQVLGHYLCKFKQQMKTKAGKTYYNVKLQDRTGEVDAKIWELSNDIQDFDEGDMIKVAASALLYQNELQFKIFKVRRSLEGEYDIAEYIPRSVRDPEEMYAEVLKIINSLENPHLKVLLENILIKNKDRVRAFKTHSAAKMMHHGYMGGLLEHTLSVAEICEASCARYKYINRDILLTGALLHDIGKIYELSPMPQNEYTNEGQMVGHIVLSAQMLALEVEKIDGFPRELASIITHLIISHHGEFEFGSPKLPCMSEAMLLHFADNMDAKLKTIEEILDRDISPGPWAGYQKALMRYIRKSDFE